MEDMREISYRHKYLKYKAKYMELSKYMGEISGGSSKTTLSTDTILQK